MKKSSLKSIALLLCITMVLAISMSGCSDGSKVANVEEDQTIVYWSYLNPSFVDANNKLIAEFEKQYPHIKVQYESFPYGAFMDKLKAAYSSKTESDVQQMFGSWIGNYAKYGLLAEVPQDMQKDINESFYEAASMGYTINGKLYGVPREVNVESNGVLYYPEDLKSVGYDGLPKTYPELIDAAKKLTKYDAQGNITHAGFDFISYDSVTYFFLAHILQQGGNYWNADQKHVNFSTPEGEKAFQEMVDLLAKHKVTDLKHVDNYSTDNNTFFFKGSSSMAYRGPWTISQGKDEFKLDNFEFGPMPSFTGTNLDFASEPGWGEVVSNNSKHKEAAWTFVKFITNPENMKIWNMATYTVPPIKAVAESPEFVEAQPMFKTTIDMLKYAKPIGPIQDIDQFKTFVNTHIQRAVDETEDVKAALKNLDADTNTMIDRMLAQ